MTAHLFLFLSAMKLTSIHLGEVTAISIGVNPRRISDHRGLHATLTSNPCVTFCYFPFVTPSHIKDLQSLFKDNMATQVLGCVFFFPRVYN